MSKRVKIAEIARRCGVSISTVSLALNHKPGIAEETRARVLAVAAELGYPIPAQMPAEKTPLLSTVGMLVKIDPEVPPQANPFYSKVILGIEDACRRKGINLLFASLPVDDRNCPLEIPALLTNGQMDGLLLVGIFADEAFTAMVEQRSIPLVLVDSYTTSNRYDAVLSDNFHAAYQAVDYLWQKGHRHIALIGSEEEQGYPSLRDRRNGYLRALKEKGWPQTYIASFNINKSRGYEETRALLRAHPQISALFCVNDEVASAALKAAQSLGKRVPEEISIIGYDDTYIASNTHPMLTTMHVDTLAMGRAAVDLLAMRLQNPESARMTLLIHPILIERESVAPAP